MRRIDPSNVQVLLEARQQQEKMMIGPNDEKKDRGCEMRKYVKRTKKEHNQ